MHPAYSRPVKYINKRCLAIAGAGVLFLGFSGSAQANPFPMSQHLGKGIGSFSHNSHDDIGSYGSHTQSDDRESFYRQTGPTHFDGSLADKAGQNRNTQAPDVQQEVAVLCTLPKAATEPNGTSNVPDGGATAMMVGAAMIGLVFIRKKQAA